MGCAPNQIWRCIDLDTGILLPFKAESRPSKSPDLLLCTADMLEIQADIIRVAQELLIKKHTHFDYNSYVLVHQRPPTEFNTLYCGPLRVVNSIGSMYALQKLVTGLLDDHRICEHFYYDRLITDQVSVADDFSEMRGDPYGSREDLFTSQQSMVLLFHHHLK